MNDTIENGEESGIYYNINQAADLLTMKVPTLKKYYILFEKQTVYRFRRNQIGHIMLGSKDIEILRRLKEVKLQPKVTLEDACEIVYRDFFNATTSIPSSVDSAFIEQLLTLINEQRKLLQQQNLLLDESLMHVFKSGTSLKTTKQDDNPANQIVSVADLDSLDDDAF